MVFGRAILVAFFFGLQAHAQLPLSSRLCGYESKIEIPAYAFQVLDEDNQPIDSNAIAYSVIFVPEFEKFDFRFHRVDIPLQINKLDDSKFASDPVKLKLKNYRHGIYECRTSFRNFVFEFNSTKILESYKPELTTERFFSARDYLLNVPILPNNKRLIPIILKKTGK